MSVNESKPAFLQRFDTVWSRMRRTQIGQAVCWALLIATAGFAALVAVDYWFEVARSNRAIGLAVVGVLALAIAVRGIVSAVRRWSRPNTATEIEARFPQLGQSVRTSVQYGARSSDDIGRQGARASLVDALTDDTEQKAAPLHIDSIVPLDRLRWAAGLLAGGLLVLLVGVAAHWEWRVATFRTLLGDQAYTRLVVAPGDSTVEEGQNLSLAVELAGRTRRTLVLLTRPAGSDESWSERELTEDDAVLSERRLARYETAVANIRAPVEYRVVAGPVASQIYRIQVRYPLAIESIRAEIVPPQYTGVAPSTVEEGNLNVIDGSTVRLHVTLDRPPATAALAMTERGELSRPGESPPVAEIPLDIEGATLSTTLQLTQDQNYSILAEAADGMKLAENKFRIHVRHDQPPQVWFEEPDEALEVHGIAEVLLRLRTRDDFGLSRAGIVFEVNNEEEYMLLEKDYREIADALEQEDALTRQTRDALQRVLPLELFGLEEKDSVTYYAFAEDNFPAGAHHAETDLRFIDIRPFRRFYRLPDPDAPDDAGNFPQVRSLQEIIARQRFNLNRTIRMDRRAEAGSDPTLVEVDRIATFEDELSKSTHELAEFLDERDFDGSDLLFQAERVMLTAVDSLNVGKYDLSSQQQKDALRLLIEGRNTIEIFLRTRATAAQRNALRSFDRMQIQKLRRPERDREDEEDPERLVERIRQLANDQDFVYKTLAMNFGGGGRQEDVQPAEVEGGPGQTDNPLAQAGEDGQGDDPDERDRADAEPADESQAGMAGGDDPQQMSRQEIEQKQQDIALEARDIERILNQIRSMSDLARSRATAAADMADSVSGALDRGSTEEATRTAERTSEELRELALNVEGVLAPEPSHKVAISRDLAGMVAVLERRLASEADPRPPGDQAAPGAAGEPQRTDEGQGAAGQEELQKQAEALARRAMRLAETGRTLEDILNSVIETSSPGDSEAVRRVDELLGQGEVAETVERMSDLAVRLENQSLQDARVEGEGIADRLENMARQLDQIYRSIVTPRVEQLMALEARAVQLNEDLQRLETNQQISTWHRQALELLEELDRANAAGEALDQLYEAMQSEGWSRMADRMHWGWPRAADRYFLAPARYTTAVRVIIEELQQQMQELILTDLVADDEEATPPKYKALVERYIQVLSSDVRRED